VLALLNENDGYLTKQRLEDKLGVHLDIRPGDSEATTYLLREGKDSHLSVRISTYGKTFKSVVDRALSGAHVEWYISWGIGWPWATGSSRRVHEGPCLKASRVRSDLLASGWTSPWLTWGVWEEEVARIASEARPAENPENPEVPQSPPELLPPIYNFFRQVNEAAGHRERLPRGQIFSDGDLAESCVTGIVVDARPPPP
jgi:hypothetical protein